ncbi:MAG: protein-methionine-sulfoxide reductase heme-binding subunit MsrQ [Anaerolineae bacterium]
MATSHAARGRPSARAWLADRWLWLLAHLVGLYPLALIVWRYTQHDLGVDPIRALYTFTGRAAIILLGLSLAATPIYIVFGWRKPLTVRRALGLYAFFYAVLHFANFVGLDYFFNLSQILQDALLNKPYIVAGLAALLILTVLAVTSTRGWQRRLKRNWVRLHWLVYAAGVLAVLHFAWQAKVGARGDPLLYGAILALLLLVRIPPIRHRIVLTRQRLTGTARAGAAASPRAQVATRPVTEGTRAPAPEAHDS